MDLALRGAGLARRSDAVLAVLEDKVEFPAFSRRARFSPYASARLAVVSCWWAEEIVNGPASTRKRIEKVLRSVDDIFVFSRNQVKIFDLVGAGHKVVPITFGVDHHSFRPGSGDFVRRTVLSAGVDRGRDFVTLVRAAEMLPDVKFTIITQAGRLRGESVPSNVELLPPLSGDAYRSALLSAELVVLPTHDLAYPTGQSVLLEAMACGKATMVTRTDAMEEYIGDGEFNFAMPPHNPEGVAESLAVALSHPEELRKVGARARVAIEERFNFDRTWAQVAVHLRDPR
ncbi:glycosyltransferase family 4 protein [Pseudoclavibacter terrae]|uniref:glycosyltransferase family 4 protein n=1 Tax=Pseudoclavibacter terrae TaxID=1530195 RepID=UPI00142F17A2|nr:glycosyltransferase [Pseudoclavibacter terrae]